MATHVLDGAGRPIPVAPRIVRSVLAGLGAPVGDGRSALRQAVSDLEDSAWAGVLPPCVVLRETWSPWVPVRLPEGSTFEAVLVLEDGSRVHPERVENPVEGRRVGGVRHEQITLELPGDLPLGYHRLRVEVDGVGHESHVIVTPASMSLPHDLGPETDRLWGVSTQLYAVRSDRSWGIGDAADLAELGTWAARVGADFVNVGPVHPDDPVPTIDPNPYRPVCRSMLDPLAIRVEEVGELGYLSAAEHQLVEWHGDDARRLNLADEIDRDAAWESKRAALRMIFTVERTHRRRRSFEQFLEQGGAPLLDYATWCVLAREHGQDVAGWPVETRERRAQALAAVQAERATDIEFECWLQWVAAQQLREAQAEVRAAGMRIGVVHDIAPGTIDGGFEQWVAPRDHAPGMHVGARGGDGTCVDLGLAALTPTALARDGFDRWRGILRAALALGGSLRLERVGTLFRQWWIPQPHAAGDEDPAQGTWVRFDHEALIGIALLEARRAGAVVIAGDESEDEPWIRAYLAERGLITSRLLLEPPPVRAEAAGGDEADDAGSIGSFPRRSMAALGSKDAPPLAAHLDDEHLAAACRYAPVADVEAHVRALRQRTAGVLAALVDHGSVSESAPLEDQVGALHRHLSGASSWLVSVRLADLVADTHVTGHHGVEHVHESWRRPVTGPDGAAMSLDDLMTSRRAKRVLRVVPRH